MSKILQIPNEIDLAAFISKEAHDIKSPFNRALGFLKLVLEGFDGPISEQAKNDLTDFVDVSWDGNHRDAMPSQDCPFIGKADKRYTVELDVTGSRRSHRATPGAFKAP